ncbi:unnamed protein product [Cylicostephanus goldi]|uniref:Enoyl reductase (ER) domain-containing protein n=1 Tax=Cylicostephanus goldi TaxID=71465 RepID=A0A3P6RHW5_CYLGO|nr:unnamed protein product [Cylicostephanus goldi]
MMMKGYGREILSVWKQLDECDPKAKRFPLTAGRDCAGVVELVGGGVKHLRPGDEVMAVVPGIMQGSHAEYVVTEESCCSKKPSNLDFAEAAAMPYVTSTAYAAFVFFARMNPDKKPSERVLIHGASGGVGTMAIQLLKAWGVDKVVATCSEESADTVRELGAITVDYRAPDARDRIIEEGPFEVILDCVDSDLARSISLQVLGVWRNCVHVSIVSPMLRDTDRHGFVQGMISTAIKYMSRSTESALRGRWFTYAFFIPSEKCMKQLSKFASEGKIKPIIEQVRPFGELPAAYEKVLKLHGKGKLVLEW